MPGFVPRYVDCFLSSRRVKLTPVAEAHLFNFKEVLIWTERALERKQNAIVALRYRTIALAHLGKVKEATTTMSNSSQWLLLQETRTGAAVTPEQTIRRARQTSNRFMELRRHLHLTALLMARFQ